VTATAPRVSIVIPVFDRLAFTRQCLDRLWRHTSVPTFEVIVVDNGSTDGTREYFEALVETAAPFQYHRNEVNLGFAAACNRGARRAAGRTGDPLKDRTREPPEGGSRVFRRTLFQPRSRSRPRGDARRLVTPLPRAAAKEPGPLPQNEDPCSSAETESDRGDQKRRPP